MARRVKQKGRLRRVRFIMAAVSAPDVHLSCGSPQGGQRHFTDIFAGVSLANFSNLAEGRDSHSGIDLKDLRIAVSIVL